MWYFRNFSLSIHLLGILCKWQPYISDMSNHIFVDSAHLANILAMVTAA